MAFTEIKKTRRVAAKGPPAIFSATRKGTWSLRLNRGGMNFIAKRGLDWKPEEKVRILYDPETGKLALKKSPDGKFRLSKNSMKMNTLRINSKDLAALIRNPTEYDIRESEEYDLILVPRK